MTSWTERAGWTAVTIGSGHLLIAGAMTREVWRDAARRGWWDTFTVAPPRTFAEAERSDAFWASLGSFSAPLVALGGHVVWSARRRRRVPAGLGWGLVAWGVPAVVTLPRAPTWALVAIGAMIIAGDPEAAQDVAPT